MRHGPKAVSTRPEMHLLETAHWIIEGRGQPGTTVSLSVFHSHSWMAFRRDTSRSLGNRIKAARSKDV
ncbi:hypothetical protein MAR_036123 [Mya arenaria]|uniref:Uncharacterized protein n=1 Tax=Mya arenaria TaxID=6604 RepID=A0ABY7EM22_MYAAR|nr:hypothetical protein MAR_036123 [Mya arenaria]